MTNNIVRIHPAVGYTISNAHDDLGNPEADLRPYLKIEDYERDKENLVSEEELNNTLSSYTTNTGLSNELDNYATKTLLNETVSDRPTFATTDAISENVDTLTDQLLETQTAKANVSHTHDISDVNDLLSTFARLTSDNTFTGTNYFGMIRSDECRVNRTTDGNQCRIIFTNDGVLFGPNGSSSGNNLPPVKVVQWYRRNYKDWNAIRHSITLLNGDGNTIINGNLSVPSITLNGNDLSTSLSHHTHSTTDITDLNTLKNEIFKMIYPIGSIYITTTPLHQEKIEGECLDYVYGWFNDCKFQLMPSNLFLKNINYSIDTYGEEIDGYFENITEIIENDNVNNIGGNETHNHSLNGTAWAAIHLVSGNGSEISTKESLSVSWYRNTHIYQAGNYQESGYPFNYGTDLIGNTNSKSNLPPYLTVYMYKRIA